MLSLFNSQRFKDDYRRYVDEISKIDDTKIKNKLEVLLGKLVAEIKYIDKQHVDLSVNRAVGISDDSKTKIKELREQLDKNLRDWASNQKSKQTQG